MDCSSAHRELAFGLRWGREVGAALGRCTSCRAEASTGSHPIQAQQHYKSAANTSFVIKKKGLIASTVKHGNEVGEGHGYLKSPLWWTGMIMMIVGEVSNHIASQAHEQ